MQIVPGSACKGKNHFEFQKYLRLKPNSEVLEKVACVGGLTLELCVECVLLLCELNASFYCVN